MNAKDGIRISVIMPVYNAEKYLKDSVKDILGQTMENIELICVDDGSRDASRKILEKFARKDRRVRIVCQEHENAGAARNRGLSHARGKYVAFWDADDRFSGEALEKLYRRAEEKEAEICVCGAGRFDENGELWETDTYLRKDRLPEKNPFGREDNPRYIFNFSANTPWNKLYRRDFIQGRGVRFQSILQANDTWFTLESLYLASRITYVDEKLIWYRVNNRDSLTGRASDTSMCIYEAYKEVWGKFEGRRDFHTVKKSLQNKTLGSLCYALNIQTKFPAYKELYLKIQEEGISLFGLDQMKEADFQLHWQYRDLQRLKEMTPEDFLLAKTYERRLDNDKIRQNANKLRELLHKERTAGISYKLWRTLRALYFHTVGRKHLNR